MSSSPKVPSAAIDAVEEAFADKTQPAMSWGEKQVGYAVAVRDVINYLRQNQINTALNEPHFIDVR